MDGDARRGRARSFLLGGLVGASAAFATARRLRRTTLLRRAERLGPPAGLAAFEDAPCFAETADDASEPGPRA